MRTFLYLAGAGLLGYWVYKTYYQHDAAPGTAKAVLLSWAQTEPNTTVQSAMIAVINNLSDQDAANLAALYNAIKSGAVTDAMKSWFNSWIAAGPGRSVFHL